MAKSDVARIIFAYSLTHLATKDKVRFYYALKGRGGKPGIVKECKIEQIAKGVLLVAKKYEKKVEDFLIFWKCKYIKKEIFAQPAKGLEQKQIFSYGLTHLKVKDKVRFYYALKGRDGKSGVIKLYKLEQLAKGVLLVDQKYAEYVEDFLKFWKCAYNKKEVFVHG